jgi:hypothetical protein
MNPIPPVATIPMNGFESPLEGVYLEAFGIFFIAVVVAAYAAMLWKARHGLEVRQRLVCPREHKRATVTFLTAPDGSPKKVVRCSRLHGRAAASCDGACLRLAAAA